MAEKEYIEREAALRAILGEPPDAHYPSWYAGTIEKIPAADVVPRTEVEELQDLLDAAIAGQKTLQRALADARSEAVWLLKSDGSGVCGRCGQHQKNVWDQNSYQPFCGKCGARMTGVDE